MLINSPEMQVIQGTVDEVEFSWQVRQLEGQFSQVWLAL
jgi:hypothetical protein